MDGQFPRDIPLGMASADAPTGQIMGLGHMAARDRGRGRDRGRAVTATVTATATATATATQGSAALHPGLLAAMPSALGLGV